MEKEIIDHKKIKIPVNYCLVKVDKDHKYFHVDGKESFLEIGKSAMVYNDPVDSLDFSMKETMDTYANHWAVTGTVIKSPEKLKFYGNEIKSILSRNNFDDLDVSQMERLGKASIKYDVDLEVKDGDRVLFEPHTHIRVSEHDEYIDTDLGRLYLVKYDMLRGVFKGEDIYPLNSIVFFRWKQETELKFGGLTLALEEKRIWDADHKEAQIGEVMSIGQISRGELNGWQYIDGVNQEIPVGSRFIFKSTHVNNVETEGHFHLFGGEEIFMIRQSDILGLIDK